MGGHQRKSFLASKLSFIPAGRGDFFHQRFTDCKTPPARWAVRKRFSQNTLRTRACPSSLPAGRSEGPISRPILQRNSFHINTLEFCGSFSARNLGNLSSQVVFPQPLTRSVPPINMVRQLRVPRRFSRRKCFSPNTLRKATPLRKNSRCVSYLSQSTCNDAPPRRPESRTPSPEPRTPIPDSRSRTPSPDSRPPKPDSQIVIIVIPERVSCVKGFLAEFWVYGLRERLSGVFGPFVGCVSCCGNTTRVVAVFASGLWQPSFHFGCTPIHPFVDPSAFPAAVRADRVAARHRVFSCDRLADAWPSQSKRRSATRPSPLTISDWPCVARASSSDGRRTDATAHRVGSLVAPVVVCGVSSSKGFPVAPFVEPEPRSFCVTSTSHTPPASSPLSAVLHRRRVVCTSSCATGWSPADASRPPGRSSTRGAA